MGALNHAPPRLDADAGSDPATGLLAPVPAPIIEVDRLWKGYRHHLQRVQLRYEAGSVVQRALRRALAPPPTPFWALSDVSFAIRPGESVALVGRNGSGKTTLLRVLSGITQPTQGQVAVTGRFATLIALGAGFNRERTGRENIYLNAAIQGVEPRRVAPIIDDIIAFSELGDFIDVPVKRFSSGMGARLGFSIAVHIAPDLLFIDEALSVGDAGFKDKSVARIRAMKDEGRTIIFVSHSERLVRQVCDRAIWLDRGRLRLDGPVDDVFRAYTDAFGWTTDDPPSDGRRQAGSRRDDPRDDPDPAPSSRAEPDHPPAAMDAAPRPAGSEGEYRG